MKTMNRVVSLLLVFAFTMSLIFVPTSNVQAATTTVVIDPTVATWGFGFDSGASGSGRYVLGPGVPPLGFGSINLQVGDATTGMIYGSQVFAGTRLDAITELKYSTYRSSADASNLLAISLQINVDYDVTDADTSWQGRLVFEPYLTPGVSGTIVSNTWQEWNTLSGKWYATGAPGNTLCAMGSPCDWSSILANWPNVGFAGPLAGIGFKAGSGTGWAGFSGNADKLVIGTTSDTTTYDFEQPLVISQVYGGAGTSGSYLYDYIEILNVGQQPVLLSNYSLQYASATGTGAFGGSTTQLTELPAVTLDPGKYYLVHEAAGTVGTSITADYTDSTTPINLSGTNGKVALATGTTSLGCNGGSTVCDLSQLSRIVDLIGYGSANFYETAAAPVLSTTTAALRINGGCTDTNNNSADFTAGATAPRNSSSSRFCGLAVSDVSVTEGNSGTVTASFTVNLGVPAPAGGVTFDIATANDTATTADSDYVAKSVTGATIAEGNSTYTFDVTVNGDTSVESDEGFFVDVTNVSGAVVSDAQGKGTITNDDAVVPALSIDDVTVTEGDSGTVTASFTVSLDVQAGAGGVTFDIATADNSATTANNDYVDKSLTGQTIASGDSSYTFDVTVSGDTNVESNETFYVNVTNVSGASVTDGQGMGTITNDDIAITLIHDIQGSGSAVTGSGPFTVDAIVVGDYQTQGSGQLRGFFLQEEDADADADPATSEGVFVFCGACTVPVSVGDKVRVTGSASEYFNMSQLSATAVSVLSSGNTLSTPATIQLPIPGVPPGDLTAATDFINAYYEAFESMLVTFPDTLSVSEYFELARYGQVILTEGGRPYTFTAVNTPDATGFTNNEIDLASRTIILDDTDNRQNRPVDTPNTGYFHPVPGLSATNYFRGGDTITDLTGVLHWSFAGQTGTDAWRIRPVTEAYNYDFTVVNTRPAAPSVSGRLKVAGFNVLNYFLTIDTDPSNSTGICGPLANVDCRGADSAQELDRQRTKMLAALSTIDADVFGLMEMENTTGVNPLADIVAGLPGYAYIDTGVIGTDTIRVGIIYKTATVVPVGNYAILDSSVDARFNSSRNRPTLAQTFEELATGERFTVAVNHLKSKGSSCGAGDDDTTTGQGNCNGTRTLAAQALADWLANDPTGAGDLDYLIIGDLNSYALENPIVALETAGYTNLVDAFGGTDAYGYVFDGQLGYLDHALSNSSLVPQVADVTEWHINADEIPLFDYNDDVWDAGESSFEKESDALPLYETNAYRTSDHDPIVIGLNLISPPTDISLSSSTLSENEPVGTLVGNLSSIDATVNDTFTYSFCGGVDDGSFQIAGNALKTNQVFDYETKNSYSICIRSTDSSTMSYSKNFNITITNQLGTSINLQSQRFYDGWVRESSETSEAGGRISPFSKLFYLGDDAANRQYRSILSFDTSSIPENAVITKATLKIRKAGKVGTNPFLTHSILLVDIRDGSFGVSPGLERGDFQAPTSRHWIGVVKKILGSKWYKATLAKTAYPYINSTGETQFRLYFSKGDNNDFDADYLKFFSGEADESLRPQLIVEYIIP